MLISILLTTIIVCLFYIYFLNQKINNLEIEIINLNSMYNVVKTEYDKTKNDQLDKSVNNDNFDFKKDGTDINNGCKTNVNCVTNNVTNEHFYDSYDPTLLNGFFNPVNVALTPHLFEGSTCNYDLNETNNNYIVNDLGDYDETECNYDETERNYIENDSTETWERMECTYNDDSGLTCSDSSYDNGSSFED